MMVIVLDARARVTTNSDKATLLAEEQGSTKGKVPHLTWDSNTCLGHPPHGVLVKMTAGEAVHVPGTSQHSRCEWLLLFSKTWGHFQVGWES